MPFTRPPLICRLIILCLFCLVSLGCHQEQSFAQPGQAPKEAKIIKIGLIPEHNLFKQKKRYEPLFAYLSEEMNLNFQLIILPRYGNIVENFNDLKLDGAFFGSFTGAMAIETLGVTPLVRPQLVNGPSTYYGLLFVRRSSGIRTAADMRNKRMVFVDRATTAGYLLPLAYFKQNHIDDYRDWFAEYYFSGTHEDAIHDVLNGLADVGAAKNTVFYRLAKSNPRIVNDLEILATSPHVPANGLAVRKDFPVELRRELAEKLLSMHLSIKGKEALKVADIDKFILNTEKDYQPVFDYAKKIGIDLSNYNYQNN